MLGMFEKIKRKDDHLDKLQHVMICTVLTQAQQWACEHKSELILQYQSCIFTHHSAVANNDLQWKKRTIAIWQFFCDYTNIFSLVLFFLVFLRRAEILHGFCNLLCFLFLLLTVTVKNIGAFLWKMLVVYFVSHLDKQTPNFYLQVWDVLKA